MTTISCSTTSPSPRRRRASGLGRRLVEAAEEVAGNLGYATVRLYTHETMAENVALYEHLGFTVTHRATERGFDRIYMSKPIADAEEAEKGLPSS